MAVASPSPSPNPKECGAVDFMSRGLPVYNATTQVYERSNVAMIVHFADGTSQTTTLDWTWKYKGKDDDPFLNAKAPMFFQFPPDTQRATEPELVQWVMSHSKPSGETTLNAACPGIPLPK
jgi:hypothetical protein